MMVLRLLKREKLYAFRCVFFLLMLFAGPLKEKCLCERVQKQTKCLIFCIASCATDVGISKKISPCIVYCTVITTTAYRENKQLHSAILGDGLHFFYRERSLSFIFFLLILL